LQGRPRREEREKIVQNFYIYLLLLGSLLRRLRHLSTALVGLLNGFDDSNSNGLSHVTDGETTKRGVLVVRFNTHRLAGDELDNAGITRLDELGVVLYGFTCSAIDLLDELSELAGNVSCVAIEDGCVTGTDLTRVVQNDDLSVEGCCLLRGVILGVGGDVSTTDILNRHVLDVESDVVTGVTLLKLLVMHFDGMTSVVTFEGAKLTTIPALMIPVSTRPTGTVPIPPIL